MSERIINLARHAGLEESDLDDLVHDVAGSSRAASYNRGSDERFDLAASEDEEADLDAWDDAYSEAASDINNGGLDAQIRYLVEELGEDEAERRIRDVIDEAHP